MSIAVNAAPKTSLDWHQWAECLHLEGRHFIDGQFVHAKGSGVFPTVNPANQQILTQVARGQSADVDTAVQAARVAFQKGAWSRMAPRARMAVMLRWAELIEKHSDEFALLDTLDMGKPIAEMLQVDIPLGLLCLRFTAECIDKLSGRVGATPSHVLSYVLHQPLGVVACIVPWNYPFLMTLWKIAPALAAGNSVVLKPAEQAPLSAALLARLFVEAGGPPGVFNVVQGLGEECGKALALHMDVDKIAFTGSGEVGKLMQIYAGQSNMKKVTTECGGKSPHVVMADVKDLDLAATWAAMGVFGNQGEVCCAGSRLIVERGIEKEFVEALRRKANALHQPGDPLDPLTQMGPLVTREHQQRVLGYIDIARKEGAQCELGGDVPQGMEAGAYVSPTIFSQVNNSMRVAQEEIFGPVACVMVADDFDDALRIANNSRFGLAAGIWTRDVDKALRFARDVECGMVYVNSYMDGDMQMPFGGWKESGNGRDKCMEAIVSYTQSKGVWITL